MKKTMYYPYFFLFLNMNKYITFLAAIILALYYGPVLVNEQCKKNQNKINQSKKQKNLLILTFLSDKVCLECILQSCDSPFVIYPVRKSLLLKELLLFLGLISRWGGLNIIWHNILLSTTGTIKWYVRRRGWRFYEQVMRKEFADRYLGLINN